MNQFFKFLFASCLGVFLALVLLFGLGTVIVAAIASQADKPQSVEPNTVLHLGLDKIVPEHTNNVEISPFDFQTEKVLGLHDVLRTLEMAEKDPNIKGIFLEADNLNVSGIAMTEALRDGLLQFRESGKFVLAYSKYYSQGSYYLASAADEVYLNPMGMVDFRGFAAMVPFFKNMLDKIGVDMQIFYAGKFKSATEPFRLTKMSEENRLQTRAYLASTYEGFLADIATTRNTSPEALRRAAEQFTGGSATTALEAGLIDRIAYREEVLGALRQKLGLNEDDEIPSISLNAYHRSNPPLKDYSVRDKVAVLYAEGSIVDGDAPNGVIGDANYTRIIRQLRDDESIKAIVLRVNSPGGSAMASENIWNELRMTREAGIPVVVSMGDYAASGGYYIAMASDSIFAQPKTLTGSIGVFQLLPNTRELFNEKLGITFDTVKTSHFAAELTPFYELSPQAQQYLRGRTEMTYDTFLQRVAVGRSMPRDSVDAIAQGRVWSGEMALQIGLVDRLGQLEDAIASAARLANMDTYRLVEYPRIKDPWQALIEELSGMEEDGLRSVRQALIKEELGDFKPYLEFFTQLGQVEGPQARLPMVIPFK